jgi:glycosyltransferase involved in cell wall biosynthesis
VSVVPLHIAFVTLEYVTEEASFDGGLANYLHRVALSLLRMGHDPVIVVASDREESLVHDGIRVHRVNAKDSRMRNRIDFLTLRRFSMLLTLTDLGWKLGGKVRRLHADRPLSLVQYSHLGGLGVFRMKEIPSVVRLSSYTPLARAKGGYDGLRPCEIRQQERMERRALRKASAVFGPSRVISALVEKDIGRPVELIESPFVMDTERTDDSVYRTLLEGKDYLFYFGTLNVLKGVPSIAEVMHDVLERHPGLLFVFAGKEREGYRGMSMMDYVRQGAEKHRNRVVYLGKLRHDQLYPVLANARAVVLPSRIDNFPNTCLEAMAHRRVIVGTWGTSFEQLLEDGKSGFLCRPDDPASLSEAIRKAMALSGEESRRMGEKAWERVQGLRPEIAVRRLLSFYGRILAATGHDPSRGRVRPSPGGSRG